MSDIQAGMVQEILVMIVPEPLTKPEYEQSIDNWLRLVSEQYVFRQFIHSSGYPRTWPIPRVEFHQFETLVADSVEEAKGFKPNHECNECKAGAEKAIKHLEAHPNDKVAFVNIWYTAS